MVDSRYWVQWIHNRSDKDTVFGSIWRIGQLVTDRHDLLSFIKQFDLDCIVDSDV